MSDGLVVVDKLAGWTSHDVVGKIRRIAGTRRVGHAGTLDPMATGVLIVGVGKATKLLGYISETEKEYLATIRLGASTTTDDAEGEITGRADASGVTEAAVKEGTTALTGDIEQVPSAVSAIKINGVRSYKRVRAGERVELPPRPVAVHEFEVLELRREEPFLDVDVRVRCSSGTYIRALARDLGADLAVGGHLTALRRTAVGRYHIAQARTLDQLEQSFDVIGLDDAADQAFERIDVDEQTARKISHGVQVKATGHAGPFAFFSEGRLLALGEDRGPRVKYLVVFARPGAR